MAISARFSRGLTVLLCSLGAFTAIVALLALFLGNSRAYFTTAAGAKSWSTYDPPVPRNITGTITIHITRAIVIRSRSNKSNARVASLQRNFARYKLPPVEFLYAKAPGYLSYTWLAWRGVFHPKFKDHHSDAQISLALAMYEAFERVARGSDSWVYVFEDDARVVNVPLGGDLVTLRDVPADAEFLAVSRQHNRVHNGSFAPAEPVIGGGLMQALLVSREGARKLVQALKPIWAPNDVILYKAGCAWVPQPLGHQSAYDLERDFGAEKKMPGIKNQVGARPGLAWKQNGAARAQA